MSSWQHCCPPNKYEFNFQKDTVIPQDVPYWCKCWLMLNCLTRQLNICFILSLQHIGCLNELFVDFYMKMLFFVCLLLVVQKYLYPVVHEHVSFSSCNVMLMMCYYVLQTTASTTVRSNKETLFINLVLFLSLSKWTCSSISVLQSLLWN